MKNSNLNNEYLNDEIDLLEILRTIKSSKKLIIIVTLAFSLLAFIYITQKEKEYQSTVIIEIGSYRLLNGEKKLIEPVATLLKKLKVNLIYKQQLKLDSRKLNINSIEDQLLQINYRSSSPELNENILNEAIKFAQDTHAEILDNRVNSFSDKVMAKDNELKFIKNSIEEQQKSQKLTAINSIKTIDVEIPILRSQVAYLLDLPPEGNNLLLLVNLKNQIQKLQQEKEALEMEIKFIAEGEFVSEKLFKFQQEKEALEMKVKLVKDQKSTTQPIRDIVTSEIKPKQLLIILIGTIFGFIFSIFIVFIRQAFLKEQN
jgi:LPS O-antigen subunit length determinant protein (WzzB/FepE family)